MRNNLTRKLISSHLEDGRMVPGEKVAIRIDHTLTQDATGTMAYLQFEALGLPRVKTELSVAYVDHNMLQNGFMNADDHIYMQTVTSKHGIHFSKPGNGICHQVNLERFGVPGKTLLGSDSHTPTAGGIGMLGIGAGGLDVALAMGGNPFYMTMPEVIEVRLTGELQPYVSAKDVILELLRRLSVKGGVGKIMEFTGPGVSTLTVPERSTITNMGAELGATSSIFPSDESTRIFMKTQQREEQWLPLEADKDAEYDGLVEIDLSSLQPMIALPHMPDQVVKVSEVEGLKVDQVVIGSCTNSSYKDISSVASILNDQKISAEVSAGLLPGSRQVLRKLATTGELDTILSAGARLLETSCGACIGMGFSPNSNGVSLRTFNRNFKGRTGTKSAKAYLCSPETAAISAIKGYITDPTSLTAPAPEYSQNITFPIDDSMVLTPAPVNNDVEIVRGPNIKPIPVNQGIGNTINGKVLLTLGDNITTDDIMPAGASILPLRSNVPLISEHVFAGIDKNFAKRAKDAGTGIIVGGENYGQGSSREHAALAPMYLGIRAVIAGSFARIHMANLINFGILPLIFEKEEDMKSISTDSELKIDLSCINDGYVKVTEKSSGNCFRATHDLSEREIEIVKAGGALAYAGQ